MSGLPVSIDDAHVDHAPPNTFDTIVQDFLSICATKNGTTPPHVLSHTEYVAGRFFDHNECAAFMEYHTAIVTGLALSHVWRVQFLAIYFEK